MKKNIYIIGAGGFGRELEVWLNQTEKENRDWEIQGFLDDNINALEGYNSRYKVLGKPFEYNFKDGDYCVIAIADVQQKEKIYNTLKPFVKFFSFFAKGSVVGEYNLLGDGIVIAPNAVVTTNVKLGNCVLVNCGTQIGHDAEIGNFSSLMANIDIGGGTILGEKVFVGSGATVIPRRKIADNVKIGAGSVVISNISQPCTLFGNPAKKII